MNLADCYRLLGLRNGASYDDIKAQYRRLARQYHPDVNPGNQQAAKEKFIQLTEAYQQLIDAVQKKEDKKAGKSRSSATKSEPPKPTTVKVTTQKAATPKPPEPSPAPARPAAKANPMPTTQIKVTKKAPTIQRDPDASPTDHQLKQSSYEQLQQLLKEQRFPRAIALVEGLAQRMPNDIEVRQWQAITYQRFGRHLVETNQSDKARIYLKKALRTDPHNKSLWYEVERDFRKIEQIEIF